MDWKKGLHGEALVENGLMLAYVTNWDRGDEMENWKARVVAEVTTFSEDTDLMDPQIQRGSPLNEKGKRQSLFLNSTEAKSAINNFINMTIKDILMLPVNKPKPEKRLPWQ
jgi:hypothetical protein